MWGDTVDDRNPAPAIIDRVLYIPGGDRQISEASSVSQLAKDTVFHMWSFAVFHFSSK